MHNSDEQFAIDADIAQLHKQVFNLDSIKEAQRRGIIVVVDFDDWWHLDSEHLFYKHYLKHSVPEKLIDLLRTIDYVTVTTELLAIEVRKYNKNVVVLPNAMDMNYLGCRIEKKTQELTFGYVGGHCHLKDLQLLRGVNNRLSGDYKFRLMGYDGSEVYNHYADIMSDSGRAGKHFDWVEKANIWNYPQFYNHMDVSLVPLVENKFSSLKSELKLIEAGFFSKAVVVSNVDPYKRLIKHKVNAMVVDKPRDWVKHCQYLIDNPEAVKDLGAALHETVKPFSIDEVNKKRLKFYRDVLEKRNTDSSVRHSRVSVLD